MATQSEVDKIYGYVQSLRDEASGALDEIEQFASGWNIDEVLFGLTPTFSPADIPSINADDMPELEKPNMPANLALEPQVIERYKTHVWEDAHLDALQETLLGYIESGGVGIDADLQTAIFEADKDRQDQTLRDSLDMAGARTGAKGFRYPTSMTKAVQSEILQKYQFDMRERSREITRLIAELAQKNVQFAIEANIKVESLHSDFAIQYAGLFQNITAALVDKYRAEVSAFIAEYDAKTKMVLAQVDISKASAEVELGEQTLLLKKWDTEVRNATERTKALIEQQGSNTKIQLGAAESLATALIGIAGSVQTNAITTLAEST